MAVNARRKAILGFLLPFAAAALGIVVPRSGRAQADSPRYASIVMDATTGAVLEATSPDGLRHPASLAKLMTLYLTFEALRDRRIALEELVPVSVHASEMQPTKLGLLPGSRLTVEQAVLGLVTRSANDAAAALGEMLGGTEDRFAQLMTLRARALGMSHTTFMNASGLPDPDAWTSARDMAILARRLINDFPGYYHIFSTPSFVFRGQTIFNHDNMLKTYPGADGLKTGYTVASGHNLVTSAVRGGHRLIGVALGCGSNAERDANMAAILNAGFRQEGVPIEERPWLVQHHFRLPSLITTAQAAEPEHHGRLRVLAQIRPVVATSGTQAGIQVGSFKSAHAARAALHATRHRAGGGTVRLEKVKLHNGVTWRAQVVGLSPAAASSACSHLAHHKHPCTVLGAEARHT